MSARRYSAGYSLPVSRPAVSLPSSRPVRAALAAIALVLTAGLAGCATGLDAQTTTYYNAPAGIDVRTGDVKGLNMLVVADEAGSATLVAALLNTADEEDELVAVTATDPDSGEQLTVTGLESPVPLPPDQLVQLIDDTLESGPVGVSSETLEPGQVLQIDLQFARAGAVSAEVPVLAHEGDYAEVPIPEPEPGAEEPEPGAEEPGADEPGADEPAG
ncbi:MAG: hypothetical protein K0Q93_907 [Nocardioidaceae bacterium]|nr:hypothetical protein [Nocardioidaceae bacterium]